MPERASKESLRRGKAARRRWREEVREQVLGSLKACMRLSPRELEQGRGSFKVRERGEKNTKKIS